MTTPSLTLSSAGTLTLEAEVTANGETARSEKTITVREEVTHATRPAGVTEGINIIDDTPPLSSSSTATKRQSQRLRLLDRRPQPMANAKRVPHETRRCQQMLVDNTL